MILVTGASGNVGGMVLQELLRAKAPVRAMYRSADAATKAPSGAIPVVADFSDPASLDTVLNGVDAVYLVCSPIPELVDLETNMVLACRAHGVKHLVLNSAVGAGDYDKSFPSWHHKAEVYLQDSGVPHTILRPESFMQNIPSFYGGTIKSDGAFYVAGKIAPVAFVDVRDVGAVGAKVLISPGHVGKTYTLTGPEALTYGQVAEKISAVCGYPVKYFDIPAEKLKQSLRDGGMPKWLVDALADLQAYYTDGPGSKVTSDVKGILGRDPITLDQFLRDNAASFAKS